MGYLNDLQNFTVVCEVFMDGIVCSFTAGCEGSMEGIELLKSEHTLEMNECLSFVIYTVQNTLKPKH